MNTAPHQPSIAPSRDAVGIGSDALVLPLRERMVYILERSPNRMNDDGPIARIIEAEDNRKRGSMHLAVKMEMRRMVRDGIIHVLPPRDRWDAYTLCLRPNIRSQPHAEDKS